MKKLCVKKYYWIIHLCFLALFSGLSAYAQTNNSPILIVKKAGNFANYTGEILKTEGFNEFTIQDLDNSEANLVYLTKFDIIILPNCDLTEVQAKMFSQYVQQGGGLIAFRPDKKLSSLFGIDPENIKKLEGYIQIEDNELIGKGLIKEPLQFHGIIDQYRLLRATRIASTYDTETNTSGTPAVCLNKFGKGTAIAFLYDLPVSIMGTRQGNHKLAGREMDSIYGLRPMDLFAKGWVDKSKNHLNQADEQMRLLTHCIEYISSTKKPLPRFWYFPDSLKSLVTLTNDGESNIEKDFIEQFKDVREKGARMTLYVLLTDAISKKFSDSLIKEGHEVAGHPDATEFAADPSWDVMNKAIHNKINELRTLHDIKKVRTNTNHWFVWCGKDKNNLPDFTAGAKIEEINGIEMDVNYAHYDNGSDQGHFLGEIGDKQGNYTGSGLVMKFCDTSGKVINVYQLFNNVYDQQYMELKDQESFFNCFKGLLDRSLESEIYSYICIRAHNNEYFFSKIPLMKMLDYAKQKNIPVWTVAKLLDFIKTKDDAFLSNIKFESSRLSFLLQSNLAFESKLTIMLPAAFNNKQLRSVSLDNEHVDFFKRQVKGKEYIFVNIKPGRNYHVEALY